MSAAQTPLVSIGLPVYNGAAFIGEAIESLLAQSFTDFEIIVTDNASTDQTPEVVADYMRRDARIRYIAHPVNIGAAANFNSAFAESRGRFFKWAAHDDYVTATFLERCVEVLEAQPDTVLVYTNAMDVDSDGHELGPLYDSQTDLWGDAEDPVRRFHRFMLENHSCIAIFGLIRRDVLAGTPLIDRYVGSDRVLLAELALHGKLIKLPEFLLQHREYAGRFDAGPASAADAYRLVRSGARGAQDLSALAPAAGLVRRRIPGGAGYRRHPALPYRDPALDTLGEWPAAMVRFDLLPAGKAVGAP